MLKSTIHRDRLKMPPVKSGMVVGLFGGSFNPPHLGHLLLTHIALRRLKLDQIWWMVSPGNPLKDLSKLATLKTRLNDCETISNNPRIKVTGFEATYGLRYSADTVKLIKHRHKGVRFIWLMGADNLKKFHKWKHWQQIAVTFPIGIIDRPGSTFCSLSSQFAIKFATAKISENNAASLANRSAPAWSFIHSRRSSLSSSAINKMRLSSSNKSKDYFLQ
jgi:nicotinate-nucleotide adenylyltransferase